MTSEKFVVDGMLGDVARWLRMLGYDTTFARNVPDKLVIEIAKKENRILLTNDVVLYTKARKEGIRAVLVEGADITEKLISIGRKLRITFKFNVERPRCPRCNNTLSIIPKEYLKNRISSELLRKYPIFWICTKCNKIYWQGKHWSTINEILSRVNDEISRYLEVKRITSTWH